VLQGAGAKQGSEQQATGSDAALSCNLPAPQSTEQQTGVKTLPISGNANEERIGPPLSLHSGGTSTALASSLTPALGSNNGKGNGASTGLGSSSRCDTGSEGGIAAFRGEEAPHEMGMLGNVNDMLKQYLGQAAGQMPAHHKQALLHVQQVWPLASTSRHCQVQ